MIKFAGFDRETIEAKIIVLKDNSFGDFNSLFRTKYNVLDKILEEEFPSATRGMLTEESTLCYHDVIVFEDEGDATLYKLKYGDKY